MDFRGVSSHAEAFARPLPLTNDQQQLFQLQSERRIYVSGAVLHTVGGAQQLLVPVRLNGVLISGTLIDSGSSLLMVSASTLAALLVPPSLEPYTSCTPNIVDIGGSPLYLLGYVVAAVAVFDIEVRHRHAVISELAFPLLIGTDVLRPHRAITVVGTPEVVCLQLDRCPV